MAAGPGKYDDEVTIVRERTSAKAVFVIVFGGFRGDGFSCQVTNPRMLLELPTILRHMADEVEKQAPIDAIGVVVKEGGAPS